MNMKWEDDTITGKISGVLHITSSKSRSKVASKFVLTNPRHAVEAVKTIELCWLDLLTLTHSMSFAKSIKLALIPCFT
jgi:hypothetical protein